VALRGVSGSLVSKALLDEESTRAGASGELRRVIKAAAERLGPASASRHVFDALALPLLRHFGFEWSVASDSASAVVAVLNGHPTHTAIVAVTGWGADLRELRETTTRSCHMPHRWWVGTNGRTLRVLDASRAYTRRALDFDVLLVGHDDTSLEALQRVFEGSPATPLAGLRELVSRSERHRTAVGRSLQRGVERALDALVRGFTSRQRRPIAHEAAVADALTVVYRILFLLFAEARGLVPAWHPIYRDSYTIESLRPRVESGQPAAGLWQTLQAIARLAHGGCRAGTLTVVPFNGRLFSPSTAPLAESLTIDDRLVRDVLLAVTTEGAGDRRARISYSDLGVEQLGAVYEHVLDSASAAGSTSTTPPLRRDTGVRKSTGTFYTPRSITEYLVRRTLAPLARGRSADDILALRVIDPAMGSGAFLVAACRYLAVAYEEALVSGDSVARGEITDADRAAFRRTVASRCLYGVDLNPTAVQLARLSLWLCTLAADRPLTFLDHHLRAGNSLAGARAIDLGRQPPGCGRRRRAEVLPLFDSAALCEDVGPVVERRVDIARQPDDSAIVVRRKERMIDDLLGDRGPLGRWRAVADAWCAAWFWPDDVPAVGPREWPSLSGAIHGQPSELPSQLLKDWRTAARAAAERERFFHWELEFPEVFFDERGHPLEAAGFDAVIGNPPWAAARALTRFARESGCYPLQGDGHANLYQLFAERMLQLAAPSRRVGMLMPGGLFADQGCSRLREALFDTCSIDASVGFDNHEGIFPIHRGMKFVLLTATRGGSTVELPSRIGLRAPADLDDMPDEGPIDNSVKVPMTLVRRFSGTSLAVPELGTLTDRAIVAKVLASIPPLGSEDGWHVSFRRELNATEDCGHFGRQGWPVLEGKLLEPFVVRRTEASQFIDPVVARRLLGPHAGRPRLGYREVASATNRVTLIAAMLPAHTVTTHTIFCLREPLAIDEQLCLCAILNGFVANYFVRLRGGTHVPASAMHHVPAPHVSRGTRRFERIVSGARHLAAHPEDSRTSASLHAATARAYGIDAADLRHILSTFPLVPEAERSAVLAAFSAEEDAV